MPSGSLSGGSDRSPADTPCATTVTRFPAWLASILLVGLVLRLLYLLAQAGSDPWFAVPAFDGAYYLSWASRIAGATPGPPGAFYLAPLYPYLLAAGLKLFGENLALLYAVQHLLSLCTAAAIGIAGRRPLGERSALAAAALFLLYPPVTFFASRPLGESVALLLLVAALAAVQRDSRRSGALAGAVSGLAILVRPNLLLVALVWIAAEGIAGRWKRAALFAATALLVIAPVSLRNLAVSGHPVLVSSNSGITAYHGNGPGARGVYSLPPGFSGALANQREEATALASRRSGRPLDPVEADRWWGREALRVRAADPFGTLGLLFRRGLLLVDSYEYGLDFAPELDDNPWRPVLRLPGGIRFALAPFALLIGLAAAALVTRGAAGSGGRFTWGAILACAATPLLFYVSSRYRLPAAALLTLPAGCGLVALLTSKRRRIVATVVGLGCVAASSFLAYTLYSVLPPGGDLRAGLEAEALSNRALAQARAGDLAAAARDSALALQRGPASARILHNHGVIAEASGSPGDAEQAYRSALKLDPEHAGAASNLAAILIRRGAAAGAIPVLRTVVAAHPLHPTCRNNLIVALLAVGDETGARNEAESARAAGVALDAELEEWLRAGAPDRVELPDEETP